MWDKPRQPAQVHLPQGALPLIACQDARDARSTDAGLWVVGEAPAFAWRVVGRSCGGIPCRSRGEVVLSFSPRRTCPKRPPAPVASRPPPDARRRSAARPLGRSTTHVELTLRSSGSSAGASSRTAPAHPYGICVTRHVSLRSNRSRATRLCLRSSLPLTGLEQFGDLGSNRPAEACGRHNLPVPEFRPDSYGRLKDVHRFSQFIEEVLN